MRSFVAGLAIFLAFLTGTAALGAFAAHQVVLNPSRAGVALDAALSDQALGDKVLGKVVPGYSTLPKGVVTTVRRVVLTPRVHQAARQVTFDPHTGEVRLKPVQSSLADALRSHGLTTLANTMTKGVALITVPHKDLKRYNNARDRSAQVALLGGIATVVLLVIALLASKRRLRTLRSIGIWTLVSCALVGALYWLLPSFVGAASSSIAAQAASVVTAANRTPVLLLLVPFAVVGAVLCFAPLLERRRG